MSMFDMGKNIDDIRWEGLTVKPDVCPLCGAGGYSLNKQLRGYCLTAFTGSTATIQEIVTELERTALELRELIGEG